MIIIFSCSVIYGIYLPIKNDLFISVPGRGKRNYYSIKIMDPRMMYDIYLPYDVFIIMGFKSGDTREKGYGITTDHPNARYYADYFIVERIYDKINDEYIDQHGVIKTKTAFVNPDFDKRFNLSRFHYRNYEPAYMENLLRLRIKHGCTGDFWMKRYYRHGTPMSSGLYDEKGKKQGIWRFYNSDNLKEIYTYKDNRKHGKYYGYENNELIVIKEYKDDKLINTMSAKQ